MKQLSFLFLTMILKKLQISFLLMASFLVITNLHISAQTTINAEDFKNPPNEYRITQYQLTPQTLKKYPEYGIGGVMGFFYSILYPESNKKQYKTNDPAAIGKLVDAANDIDYKVWLADDWGYYKNFKLDFSLHCYSKGFNITSSFV